MLSRDLRAIDRFEVLERRNPLFDGVTTGVLAGGDFFYMANIQDDKKAGFDPITILKSHLVRSCESVQAACEPARKTLWRSRDSASH